MKKLIMGGAVLALALMGSTAHAADLYVDSSGEYDLGSATTTAYTTIQAAITAANPGDIINVAAGTYVEVGQILINKDLTITGNSTNKPVIKPSTDFTGASASQGWWLVQSEITFNLSNVVLDGGTQWINRGLRSHGHTTVNAVDFKRIQGSLSGNPYTGFAVLAFGGTVPEGAGADSHSGGGPASSLTVSNSTFENIGRVGILVKGTEATANISGNTYTGKGSGLFLDYAVEVGAGGSANISGNTFSGNLGVAGDTSTSAGILVTEYYGSGTNAVISGNTFSGNSAGLHVGYLANDSSIVTAQENNFSGETIGIRSSATTVSVNAENNWWGVTASTSIASKVDGLVDYTPWSMNSGFSADSEDLPVVTLNGEASVTTFDRNGYTDPGATAVDSIGRSLDVVVTGVLDASVAGTYTLTYTATDENGNSASATRTITVLAASSGRGSRGQSSGAASTQALAAVTAAGVTLPAPAAPVIGQVLGAETINVANMTPAERQAAIVHVKSQITSLISQLISILQAQLAQVQAQNN